VEAAQDAFDASHATLAVFGLEPSPALVRAHTQLVAGQPEVAAIREVVHNLPAPTYASFVHGADEIKRLNEWLGENRTILALLAPPGRGRTVIAHYFAFQQVQERRRFHTVLWVSDERGTHLTLRAVLNALTLLTDAKLGEGAPAERGERLRDYFSRVPSLLVLDAEGQIEDAELLAWLTRFPAPSKVLVTSTRMPTALAAYAERITVPPPGERHRIEFTKSLLRDSPMPESADPHDERFLRLWKLGANYRDFEGNYRLARLRGFGWVLDPQQADATSHRVLDRIWDEVDPKARQLAVALGLLRHGARWPDLVDLLDDDSLLAEMDSLDELGLIHTAGLEDRVYLLEEDVLPLVGPTRAIADPHLAPIVERWIDRQVAIAESVGFCPDDVARLLVLDDEFTRRNLEFAVSWAFEAERFGVVARIAREVRYYYYVRGLWSSDLDLNAIGARAARARGDVPEEFDALVYRANITAKQGDWARWAELESQIGKLADREDVVIGVAALGRHRHVRALAACGQGRCADAEMLWRENIALGAELDAFDLDASERWLARCLSQRADPEIRAKGRAMFEDLRATGSAERPRLMGELEDLRAALGPGPTPDVAASVLDRLAGLEGDLARVQDARFDALAAQLRASASCALGLETAEQERLRAAELWARLGIPDDEGLSA
jgi:hypothetical protein